MTMDDEGLEFICPVCGFTVMTPNGEEELKMHVEMHIKVFHPDMTSDRIKGAVKTVSLAEVAYHRV